MQNPFEGLGMVIKEILFLSPAEAYEAVKKGAVLVDIREEYDNNYKMYDVDNLIYSSFFGFADRLDILPSGGYLIIADSTGNKSKEIARFLHEKGFDKVAVLNGGVHNWELKGMPLKKDKSMQLTGSCLCTMKTKGKRNLKR